MLRRFFPVGLLGLGLLMALSVSGSAAVQIERSLNFSSASANFFQFTSAGFSNAFVNVTAGDSFLGSGTFLDVFVNSPQGFFGGCFQIPDGDFTSSDAGASLKTTVTQQSPRCPFGFFGGAVSSNPAGQLGGAGVSALGAGGIGSPPFPPPQLFSVSLNLTWTVGTNPQNVLTFSNSQSCLDNQRQSQESSTFSMAPASGTITGFAGPVSSENFAFKGGSSVSHTSAQVQVQTAGPSAGCLFFFGPF